MGCLMPKKSHQNDVQEHDFSDRKSYSWSRRDKSQSSKYIIENESNSTVIRLPGEINGEQFIIENCNDSTICLFDFSNTIAIDDCKDCTFFIGPTNGSIVLRNCQDCRLMSASQQFRSRDCKRLDLYLFCATQPAIESCYDLNFSCYSAHYNGLQEQFEKTNLKIYNNRWFDVYDFSIDNQEKHWTTRSLDLLNEHFCTIPLDKGGLNVDFNPLTSLVPKTEGITLLEDLKSECDESLSGNQKTKLGILAIYTNSLGPVHKVTIENQIGKILQEISLNLQGVMLLITKYIDLELSIEAILNSIVNGRMGIILKGQNQTTLMPNQMIVLVFRGNFIVNQINEICQRIISVPQLPEVKFKTISSDQQSENFKRCLSLTFESSF